MKWKYHLFELMLVIGLLNAPTTIALSTSNDLMLTNSIVPAPIIQKDRCNVFKTIILHTVKAHDKGHLRHGFLEFKNI